MKVGTKNIFPLLKITHTIKIKILKIMIKNFPQCGYVSVIIGNKKKKKEKANI